MRLLKTSTRQRLVIVALALLAFGLSTTVTGAMLRVSSGQAGKEPLASQYTFYAVSESRIPIRNLIPVRDFAPKGPALVDADVTVDSRPLPARDSGLTLVLVGLSLVGGAIFVRRITPGRVSSLRPDIAPSPTANFIPAKRFAP
jgi:hypothetical protein